MKYFFARRFAMKKAVILFAAVCLALVFTENTPAQPLVVVGPVYNPQTGNDYYLLSPSTWTVAQAQAITLGGNLATINDPKENDWVCQTFGSAITGLQGIWIGLNDAEQEGVFRWGSGEPVVYTNWEINQPDNMVNKEDYVHMWTPYEPARQTGRWNDMQNEAYIKTSGVVEIELTNTLVDLTIEGPSEAAENSTIPYKAIAHYDDGSIHDVTAYATWSVIPNDHAAIDEAGNLTTYDLEKFQNVAVTAQYAVKGVALQADKTVTLFAVCPSGTALEFDGQNDYVQLPSGFSDFSNGLTIMLWARPTQVTPWARFIEFSTNGPGNNTILFSRGGPSNDLLFDVYTDRSGGRVYTSQTIDLNVWQHLAVTLDHTGHVVLYKNGQPVKTGMTGVPQIAIRNTNYIGKSNWSGDGYYAGQMDDIRVYNRALTQQEIQEGMHIPSDGDIGLLAYWNFDEGSGQVVHDLSSNGNNGQLGSRADADSDDPVWVASDAPVGVCTPYLLAVQNIKTAVAKKLQILAELESTLENEQSAIGALRDMLAEGDLGDLKRADVLKSITDIRLAMVQQQVSRMAIRRSVIRLEESLSRLGVEVPPHQWPDTPEETQTHNPADINMDGQVNLLDLAILSESWNQSD
jgi:hypothetical protein